MIVTQGLFDHMVLQRGARGEAAAEIAGACTHAGTLAATVRRGGRVWKGIRNRAIGRARGGRFAGRLPPLATGGPYDIEFAVCGADGRARERLRVRDVLVGDVWLAAGQSNMQGCGHCFRPPPRVAQVRAFTMDDRWQVAADPLHNLSIAVDPAHALLCGAPPTPPPPHWGTGPSVAFAQILHAATGIPQGVIACAHGGTTMDQWDSARAPKEGNRCLFGALLRRLRKNGGRVAGMIWFQGCSDANPADVPLYTARMRRLLAAVRHAAHDPRLPVAAVQIARHTDRTDPAAVRCWNAIQEQQRRLHRRIPRLTMVPSVDLPLDDGIHISEDGQYRLGRRLAEAMRTLRGECGAFPPPIAPGRVRLLKEPRFGRVLVEVTFDHVVGRLASRGSRPFGFTLPGAPAGAHFDTVLDGCRVLLRTSIPWAQASQWQLSCAYGLGADPACNVTDAADRSLPVFEPVRIGRARALSPPVKQAWVSALLPPPPDRTALQPPADPAVAGLAWRDFPCGWLNLRPEIAAGPQVEQLLWFVIPFRCAEPMRLSVSLGYDGPVRAWLDGAPLADDPRGVNPCVLGKRRRIADLSAGPHRLALALSTNGGRAWGAMAQFERLGLPQHVLRQGGYAMPEIESQPA